MKIFKHSGTILAIFLLANSIFTIILKTNKYKFKPSNEIFFLGLVSAVVIAVTVLGVKNRKETSKLAAVFCGMMPFIAVVFSIINPLTDFFRKPLWLCGILFIIVFSCGVILFFACGKGRGYRIACGVCTGIILVPLIYFMPVISIFAAIGENTTVREIESPNGQYTAYLVNSDQGALGGNTLVEVSFGGSIDILIGKLIKENLVVYTGKWGEFFDFSMEWKDNDTLILNGVEYNVN